MQHKGDALIDISDASSGHWGFDRHTIEKNNHRNSMKILLELKMCYRNKSKRIVCKLAFSTFPSRH